VTDFTPLHTPWGFFTSICYSTPQYLRVAVKPGHDLGIQGSTFRPLKSALMPKRPSATLTKVHAAVLVSQLFLASPKQGASAVC
jgi:hypothetical protein